MGPFVRVGGSSGPATLSVTVHRQQEFSIWQELTGGPVVGVVVSVRATEWSVLEHWLGRRWILSSFYYMIRSPINESSIWPDIK